MMTSAIAANNVRFDDATVLVNGAGIVLFVLDGDSMMGTTSVRPPNVGDAAIPALSDGIAFEILDGVLTDLNDNSPRAGDISYANYRSPWPRFALDFYNRTGLKACFMPVHSGGAEVYMNGDDNNWGPTGTHRATSEADYATALSVLGVDRAYALFRCVGINDYNAQQTNANIKGGWIDFNAWTLATYPDVPVYMVNIGTVNDIDTDRIINGRYEIQNIAADSSQLIEAMSLEGYWDAGYYASPGDDDGIHLAQTGNNQMGLEMNEALIKPRFSQSFRYSDAYVNNLATTSATLNILMDRSGTAYWAVYPTADAAHSKADIAAGTGAVVFGTVSATGRIHKVALTGLTNNTWYRVHHYGVSQTKESDVFMTNRFYTRTPGSLHPTTTSVLARRSGATANQILRWTTVIEDLLDIADPTDGSRSAWDAFDYIYDPRAQSADKFVTMKGETAPSNLNSAPTFTEDEGFDFPPTGTNRITLNFNHSELAQFLAADCVYFFSVRRLDENGTSAQRAMFGAFQTNTRSSRAILVNGNFTYCISEGAGGNDYTFGDHWTENTVYAIGKIQGVSSTLNSEVWISGKCEQVTASTLNETENDDDWYYGAQNNNGSSSSPFDGIPGFLAIGQRSRMDMRKVSEALLTLTE